MKLCIPTYCNYEGLKELIRSAEAGSEKPSSYDIIDNGGERLRGGELQALATGEVVLYSPTKNLGVAASWNHFLHLNGQEPLVISNDDIVLGKDAFAMLKREADAGTPIAGFGWALFMQSPVCTTRVGYYDENFFPAYYEDIDYIQRMRLAGVPEKRLEGKIDIVHRGWQTTNLLGNPAWLADGREKNHSYFVAKWGAELEGETFREAFDGHPPPEWNGFAPKRFGSPPLLHEVVSTIGEEIRAKRYLVLGGEDSYAHRITIPEGRRVAGNQEIDQFLSTTSERFDVVVIDGEHTWQRVMREYGLALGVLSKCGVIIMHDTSPHSEEMQRVPYAGSHAWTGNAWRAVVELRKFRSRTALCTLNTHYGITIVVPRAASPEPPIECGDIHDISYDELARYRREYLGLMQYWEDWRGWLRKAAALEQAPEPGFVLTDEERHRVWGEGLKDAIDNMPAAYSSAPEPAVAFVPRTGERFRVVELHPKNGPERTLRVGDEFVVGSGAHAAGAWLSSDPSWIVVKRLGSPSLCRVELVSEPKKASPLKLNLGCSTEHKAGYVNVDRVEPADFLADLTKPWPWADSSVDEIRAFDVVEHLPDKILTMNEAYRVLKPGGILHLFVPTTDGRGAFQDPTHVSYWNAHSLWYYESGNAHRERFGDAYGVKARFRIDSQKLGRDASGTIEHLEAVLICDKPKASAPGAEPPNTYVALPTGGASFISGPKDVVSSFASPPKEAPARTELVVIFDRKLRSDTTGAHLLRALDGLAAIGAGPPVRYVEAPCVVRNGHVEASDTDYAAMDFEHARAILCIDDDIGWKLPTPPPGVPMYYWCIDSYRPNAPLWIGGTREERIRDRGFASIFYAQSGWPPGAAVSHWLPLGVDLERYYHVAYPPTLYDWCFIGKMSPERAKLCDELKHHFPKCYFGQIKDAADANAVYNQSAIAINLSAGEVNMRVFEAQATSALLITNRFTMLAPTFPHLPVYERAEDLIETMKWWLARPALRKRVSYQQSLDMREHTYEARALSFIEQSVFAERYPLYLSVEAHAAILSR